MAKYGSLYFLPKKQGLSIEKISIMFFEIIFCLFKLLYNNFTWFKSNPMSLG